MISASEVLKLRQMTGAGMMDCKNALEEAGGDIEKAADLLRKKGIVKAAKRAGKIASEGLALVKTAKNTGAILEVNCETDFVGKNEGFRVLAEKLLDLALENKPKTTDEFLALPAPEAASVTEFLNNATAKIGEKISLRRLEVLEKTDSQTFGSYIHMGGRIAVLILLDGGDENLARDIAMHAAASNPKYVDRSNVPAADLEREKEIYKEQLKGKPENIVENILRGKIEKFYEENCLVDQPFIKDEDKKIKELLGSVWIKRLIRYELGEGMEKRSDDFAAEVEAQLK